MMKLQERSFSNNCFRPRPLIQMSEDGRTLILLTPWGEAGGATAVMSEIEKLITSTKEDSEMTSVFRPDSSVGRRANQLRSCLLTANQLIYRSTGKDAYSTAYEVIILTYEDGLVSWARVGQPNIYIARKGNMGLQSIHVSSDLSLMVNQVQQAPLPSELFGIESELPIACGEFQVQNTDKIILHAGSMVSSDIWSDEFSDMEFSQISSKILSRTVQKPFWLGQISL